MANTARITGTLRRLVWLAVALFVIGARNPSAAQPPADRTRPLHTLSGLMQEAYSVTYSPDGKLLAAASNVVVVAWDPATGKQEWAYRTKGMNVFGLAFSPDGRRSVAVGVSRQVKILDAKTGTELTTLGGGAHFVFRIAFSPDGKFLAASSGSSNNTGEVCIWDVATGKPTATLHGHPFCVLGVAYSSDGRLLASAGGAAQGSKPGDVRVWDMATRRERLALPGNEDNVYGVAFAPGGRRLVSAGGAARGTAKAGTVKLWEVATGEEVVDFTGHSGPVFSVAFSPDGCRVATGSGDKTVRLWEATTGKEILQIPAHAGNVYSVAFNPDGRTLASTGVDGTAKIWEVPFPATGGAANLSAAELQTRWGDITSADARKAYLAVWALAADPAHTIPFLRGKVRPAAGLSPIDQKLVERCVRDVGADSFKVRENASAALARQGEAALGAIESALAANPSAEARRRLQILAESMTRPALTPEGRAALRAVESLEYAATPDARALLAELAAGAPAARLTIEAKAALERLTKRAAASKPQSWIW